MKSLAFNVALLALIAQPVIALERLEPPEGCYFGVNLGEGDTIDRLSERLGITPAVYVQFFHFPLTTELRADLNAFLDEVRPTQGIALITLEPFEGLDRVTATECLDLATICASHEAQGIGGILIRFAHEMNGNWYPWCQKPALYREKFRLLSGIVRANTSRTAMLWAPHNGIGYPFSTSGLYQAAPGSPDFAALDTNGDGRLTAHDDMYEPYYPGNDAVDWVGMTIYHWGVTYPWLENEMPPQNSFAAALTGAGHQPPIPNFYARYCVDAARQKPLAVPESAAFYNPHQPAGPGEFPIKQAWWRQLFNISGDSAEAVDIAAHFPKLKCINWFDHYKPEPEAQNQWTDWRISASLPLRQAFIEYLRTLRDGKRYFLTAQEVQSLQSPYGIAADRLPAIVPLSGEISMSLRAKAAANCDLVIDLLDQSFNWLGGTRVPVSAGTNVIAASFNLVQPLTDGTRYRWSIFLTPTGSNYLGALAWYNGIHPVARATNRAVAVVAYPPVWPAGASSVVRVKYALAEPALIEIEVLGANANRVGSGNAQATRRHGYADIAVALQPGLPDGAGSIRVVGHAESVPVVIRGGSGSNSISVVPEPPSISAGDVFRFAVGYVATNDCDLHIDLFDAGSNFLSGTVQRVGPSSGIQDMTISLPWAQPGRYFVTGFITPPGQTFAQALAWSAEQRVDVVAADYTGWSESAWGAVLVTDLSHPQEDADRDRASNWEEFIALTHPRDPGQRLQLAATVTGGQLRLSWLSSSQRSYQLFESVTLGANSWTPVLDPIAGTGTQVDVPMTVGPAGHRKFYRVQAFRP